jgi:protein SCO1/2
MKRTITILLLSVVFFIGCSSTTTQELPLPFYNHADFTSEWIDEGDDRYEDIHTIAPFNFVNQNGETITERSFQDKIYVANFFFTICPGVCPRMTANLLTIQEAFKADENVNILSHTVMPWVDSVSVLKSYAELKGVNSAQWHLVTGTKADIYTTARDSYFADEGFGKTVTIESDFLHTENIVLIDTKRRIRGVYNGTLPLEMRRLIEDIHILKKEG